MPPLGDRANNFSQSGELFNKITNMKRDPQNDNAAARRASLEEQTVPRGAGPIGDMWNKYVIDDWNETLTCAISVLTQGKGSPGALPTASNDVTTIRRMYLMTTDTGNSLDRGV